MLTTILHRIVCSHNRHDAVAVVDESVLPKQQLSQEK